MKTNCKIISKKEKRALWESFIKEDGSLVIPDNITEIPDYALKDCTLLTTITIGNSVKSIGKDAFSGCTSLIKVNYTGTIDEWVQIEFGNEYANPLYYTESLYINNQLVISANITTATKISNYAFYYCNLLMSVTIGNSVKSICEEAFARCGSLKSVTIGNNVKSIGNLAFYECRRLTNIKIGNNVRNIGSWAFYKCDSLTSVVVPDSVTSIDWGAFERCDALTSITLPFIGAAKKRKSNTHFGYIFGASSYSCNDNYVPYSLGKVIITGDSSIGDYAFYKCNSLTSVEIPNNIKSIGSGVFYGCRCLQYNIKDGLKYLGNSKNKYLYLVGIKNISITTANIDSKCRFISNSVFYNCSSLTNVVVPNNIISIGLSVFERCSSLTSIVITR